MAVRASKRRADVAKKRKWRIGLYSLLAIVCLLYLAWLHTWHQQAEAILAIKAEKFQQPPVYVRLGSERLLAPAFSYSSPSSIWYMTNKSHPIKHHDYVPKDLVPIPMPVQPQLSGEEAKVRTVVAKALEQLNAAAKQDNVELIINSAYRSYQLQEQLIAKTSSSLYDTGTRTAPAGASEHQLGLAVDFSSDTPNCHTTATNCYIHANDASWLATHAHHYGFILRYPEHKETITGYQYEPWHYRYVGKPLAEKLYISTMTLDEAWPHLQKAEHTLRARGDI